ncbi:hypothetical protein [Paenibacillus pinihumi]|uniref:hypothetical protein n=1 Tax=Paenibacillus pinihumi TaxID=669462 RepID=UPI00040986B1|nr:hypothetical protein [Paenibacillus pinihumi]
MNKLLYRTVGRYYLGEAQEQARYVFQLRDDAPKELRRSFLIYLDRDGNFSGSALQVARDIKDVVDSYFLNTDKPRIAALVDYLEKWEGADHYDGLIAEREMLKRRLELVNKELDQYEEVGE